MLRWRPFITSIDGTVAGHVVGDRYIAVTNVGAPRGRLVAIDISASDPNDPASWRELVGESDATLRSVTPVGDALYLSEFVDTYSRVRIVDAKWRTIGRGSITWAWRNHGAAIPTYESGFEQTCTEVCLCLLIADCLTRCLLP